MYPYIALFVLFLVYAINYLDRSLIYALFPLIKKEFAFTDLQLALLGSTAFVLFYTLLGVPFGKLADSVKRTRLIAAGLLTWSLFSGLTGAMTSFAGLFACRLLVGVGEASLGPAALSLLSDYFPQEKRATVSAVYSAGIPVGAAMALFLGGQIGQHWGWRWAFYLLSFPGVVLCLALLLLKEPQRRQKESIAKGGQSNWRYLFSAPPLRFHYLGYALIGIPAAAIGMWIPTYVHRVFALPMGTVGLYTGLAALCGGLLGTLLGGYGADRLRKVRTGGRMLFMSMLALCNVPLWLLLLNTTQLPVLILAYGVLMGTGLSWLGPAAADVQDIVGPSLRGLAVGVYFFLVNLANAGIAPPLIGHLNDVFGVAKDPTQMQKVLLICPLCCLLGALVLYLGSRKMEEIYS